MDSILKSMPCVLYKLLKQKVCLPFVGNYRTFLSNPNTDQAGFLAGVVTPQCPKIELLRAEFRRVER